MDNSGAQEAVKAAAEGGKAVAEVAKFGGKVVDAASGAGSYFVRVVGTIPEDVLGIAGGDWLHQKRKRNLIQMEAKTAAALQHIGAGEITEPSPSVIVPLLQAAADEGRDELQDLWAALLAQAMINGGRRVRRTFFEVLRQMEATDALVLREIARVGSASSEAKKQVVNEAAALGIKGDEFYLSVEALERLGCVVAVNFVQLTTFGSEFVRACGLQPRR